MKDENGAGGVPTRCGKPRQSNYGDYRLPDVLADIPGLDTAPLYQAVALWGWRLGRAFCRDELARAFHISVHRAGDVMSYIRRARADRVASRLHHKQLKNGARQRYLLIVAEPAIAGQRRAEARGSPDNDAPMTEAALQELRRWFLCRANPG